MSAPADYIVFTMPAWCTMITETQSARVWQSGWGHHGLYNVSMAEIMFGRPVADEIEQHVRGEVKKLRSRNIIPRLDVVLVGKSPASQRYVKKKIDFCERLGMQARLHAFDDHISAGELRDQVQRLNGDPAVHAILVQLPLPRHIEEPASGQNKFDVFDAISGAKDVDGIARATVPELYRAQEERILHLPATALAVRRMLAFYGIETEGKVAVIVGRNDITAKPIHHMLGGRMCNATAIWCHRYTRKTDHDCIHARRRHYRDLSGQRALQDYRGDGETRSRGD